jgi:hypothetical protein
VHIFSSAPFIPVANVYGTWSLTPMKEHKLMPGKKELRRIFGPKIKPVTEAGKFA